MFATSYKRSEHLLAAEDSLLLFIDIQEKFRKIITDMNTVIHNSSILQKSATKLGIPIIISEQYPNGLGTTVTEIEGFGMDDTPILEKLTMSALGEPTLFEKIKQQKKRQIIITGVETHICVNQTVFDLLANFDGWIYVVADAVSSRREYDKTMALNRMREAGAHIITTEMAVFEWLKEAGTPTFKEIQKLII
ncbi:MAG: isochorismatase family protein [Fibrobacteria bacterium]|nr:isochorismatase family protein [Fibrobacteria bacterium]